MLIIRSALFYFGMVLTTLLFSPLGIIIYPLPLKLRFTIMSKWATFNLWWLKITCHLDYIVTGKENIPDVPSIIMCKHQSAWETLALQQIFPPQVWVLKKELLYIPIYGWGLASMNPIAIDRTSTIKAFKQIIKQGIERLHDGLWVVIFPEGTRVAPGTRKKYLPGGGLLAEKTGCPVVPVAHNSGYFWPRKSFLKHPGTITMVIGKPIITMNKTAHEITLKAEEWIEKEVNNLAIQHK